MFVTILLDYCNSQVPSSLKPLGQVGTSRFLSSGRGNQNWVREVKNFRHKSFDRFGQSEDSVRWPYGQYRLPKAHRRIAHAPSLVSRAGSLFGSGRRLRPVSPVSGRAPLARGTISRQWDLNKQRFIRSGFKNLPQNIFCNTLPQRGQSIDLGKSRPNYRRLRRSSSSRVASNKGLTTVRIVLQGWQLEAVNYNASAISWFCSQQLGGRWRLLSLPRCQRRWTLIKSPFVNKKSREQFESRSYKRIIEGSLPKSWKSLPRVFWDNVIRDFVFPGVHAQVFWDSKRTRSASLNSGIIDGVLEKSQVSLPGQEHFSQPEMYKHYTLGWARLEQDFWCGPPSFKGLALLNKFEVLSLQGSKLLSLINECGPDKASPELLSVAHRWCQQWSSIYKPSLNQLREYREWQAPNHKG